MPLYTSDPGRPLTDAQLSGLLTQAPQANPALRAAAEAFLSRNAEAGTVPPHVCAVWLLQGEEATVAGVQEPSPCGGDGDDGAALVSSSAEAAPAAGAGPEQEGQPSQQAEERHQRPARRPPRQCPEWLGSADATTCVILVVWCPATRAAWAGHLDAAPSAAVAARLRAAVETRMARPRAYLAGGYSDAKGAGPRLALAVLGLLHGLPAPVQLALACVGAANTAPCGAPRSRRLAVDLETGAPRPWGWADGGRGPEHVRRFAAQHVR
jgi:hypothetical protein